MPQCRAIEVWQINIIRKFRKIEVLHIIILPLYRTTAVLLIIPLYRALEELLHIIIISLYHRIEQYYIPLYKTIEVFYIELLCHCTEQ